MSNAKSEHAFVGVFHDDQPNEIIAKVNELIGRYGLEFVDTGEENEGLIVYRLEVNPPTFGMGANMPLSSLKGAKK